MSKITSWIGRLRRIIKTSSPFEQKNLNIFSFKNKNYNEINIEMRKSNESNKKTA